MKPVSHSVKNVDSPLGESTKRWPAAICRIGWKCLSAEPFLFHLLLSPGFANKASPKVCSLGSFLTSRSIRSVQNFVRIANPSDAGKLPPIFQELWPEVIDSLYFIVFIVRPLNYSDKADKNICFYNRMIMVDDFFAIISMTIRTHG